MIDSTICSCSKIDRNTILIAATKPAYNCLQNAWTVTSLHVPPILFLLFTLLYLSSKVYNSRKVIRRYIPLPTSSRQMSFQTARESVKSSLCRCYDIFMTLKPSKWSSNNIVHPWARIVNSWQVQICDSWKHAHLCHGLLKQERSIT